MLLHVVVPGLTITRGYKLPLFDNRQIDMYLLRMLFSVDGCLWHTFRRDWYCARECRWRMLHSHQCTRFSWTSATPFSILNLLIWWWKYLFWWT